MSTPREPADPGRRSRPHSRSTTPLRRPHSRGSAHGLQTDGDAFPLNTLEPAFAELSDGMAILEANMGDMQVMHESLSRFSESFAGFLYGLNMNAFCVDFPEAPVKESFQRAAELEEMMAREFAETGGASAAVGHAASGGGGGGGGREFDAETTFMTSDSFVNEPATVMKGAPTPMKTPARRGGTRGGTRGARGARAIARGRGGVR